MFSLASIATMSACIFLFGLFFSILVNFQYIIRTAEEGVAITVFFDEDATDEQKEEIGEQLENHEGVADVKYVSAEEAWEEFQKEYFGDNPELAEGFKDDNPLASSDNYEVYMETMDNDDESLIARSRSLSETQNDLVKFAQGLDGVREVNKSDVVANTLSSVQYTFQCEYTGSDCVNCDYYYTAWRVNLPDQQYCYNGYYSPKGRDRDHEIYRRKRLCGPVAVCDRGSDHWCIRCRNPADAAVLSV